MFDKMESELAPQLKVGIISDGKYGERAFSNIKNKFNTIWIEVPDIPSNVFLEDDIDLNIPECDLYISYVRHPDIIIQLAELNIPLILGILPGQGLYHQLKQINKNVVHSQTMCSLRNNTGIDAVDKFSTYFGEPLYNLSINSEGILDNIEINRSSLCGSTEAGAKFLVGKKLTKKNLREFALRICHECKAPRFGRTCDKEVAGIIHLKYLLESIKAQNEFLLKNELLEFISEVENEYNVRKNQ
ncbi:MAG: hypothetical protein GF353_10525 [Candidatus Lokiarchaeota archaeon]|nr:hypothetical protein [Candidatus Lokiarchaeota archaeon]